MFVECMRGCLAKAVVCEPDMACMAPGALLTQHHGGTVTRSHAEVDEANLCLVDGSEGNI